MLRRVNFEALGQLAEQSARQFRRCQRLEFFVIFDVRNQLVGRNGIERAVGRHHQQSAVLGLDQDAPLDRLLAILFAEHDLIQRAGRHDSEARHDGNGQQPAAMPARMCAQPVHKRLGREEKDPPERQHCHPSAREFSAAQPVAPYFTTVADDPPRCMRPKPPNGRHRSTGNPRKAPRAGQTVGIARRPGQCRPWTINRRRTPPTRRRPDRRPGAITFRTNADRPSPLPR